MACKKHRETICSFRTKYVLFLYVLTFTVSKIDFCNCKNESLVFFIPSRLQKESEELSNQKQYVVSLNAKVLAQERERLEKSFQQQNLFNFANNHKRAGIDHEKLFDKPSNIGSYLRKITNEELCVTTMQAIYDDLPSYEVAEDSQQIVNE
ncbi:uncharacterized protein LOC118190070, partial [Stegodyphus dumicola]|uniref:uncharacterized protein LOC118190070 n=1 Tax=Stegodyphus dumicola TaxID=202533 RepID=UPI0015B1734E